MQTARHTEAVSDLARGPGRLAKAMDIGPPLDGLDLCVEGPLWLATDGADPGPVGTSVRIGITRAAERPLRFYVRGSRFVSGPGRLRE